MENKKFTNEEKQLIALYDKVSWVARDKCGSIHGFIDKPYKDWDNDIWTSDDDFGSILIETGFKYNWDKAMFKNISFEDIQWEDEEPTSREEILGEEQMELKDQLQKIISKYVDGFKVGQPNGTKENFKVILNNEYKETIVMEYAFPFGAGLAVGEIFACQGITKKLGELLQNLKRIEIELDNLNKEKKNDGTKTDYINTVVQQDSKRR